MCTAGHISPQGQVHSLNEDDGGVQGGPGDGGRGGGVEQLQIHEHTQEVGLLVIFVEETELRNQRTRWRRQR